MLSLSDGLIMELEKIKSKGKVITATPTQISHRFQRAMKATNLEHFRFHDLRHPYGKHTTKKYDCEKQKSQATKKELIAWGFCFYILIFK